MKIYIYYEGKEVRGGMGGPEDKFYGEIEYYSSLTTLLKDHPKAKQDGPFVEGEVYKEAILK